MSGHEHLYLALVLMDTMRNYLSISLFILSCTLQAQHVGSAGQGAFSCRNHDPEEMEQLRTSDPEGWQRALEARQMLDQRTGSFEDSGLRGGETSYIIPVVFHIIHDNGPENISDAQVQDAIRILNDDYNKLNADWVNVRPEFLDLVADVGIEFRLAQRDPQGNCTNGITRTVSDLTYEGNGAMKDLIQWPRNRYMNVWVGASANGAAGYTNYPWVFNNWPEDDGIVLKHDYTGSIGTGSVGRSRTLTHEVGHWLNLPHCWGNSNDPGTDENCSMDDGVADTPLTRGWTSCLLSGASCGSELDNVENYMEYSYCAKMFTTGQGIRMLAALTSSVAQRSSLWQASNLEMTGVYDLPELCQVRIRASQLEFCAGTSVQFLDESFGGVTSRSWSFPGGEPATSSEPQPLVTYLIPGIYPVSLTVGDGTNVLSSVEEISVIVLPDTGTTWPIEESFEGTTVLEIPEWTVLDPDGDGGFQVTNAAAYTGNTSIRLGNTSSNLGRMDAVISSTYDVSEIQGLTVSFRYAFARRNGGNSDRLRLYVSNNCGATWSPRKTLLASDDLSTAPDQSGTFVPGGPDDWGFAEVSSFGANNHVSDLRLKFEFTSGGGNWVYIDDINVTGTAVSTSVQEATMDRGFTVIPNPASQQARLTVDKDIRGPIEILAYDALGKQVARWNMAAGDGNSLVLDVSGWVPGAYHLLLRTTDNVRTTQLIIQ